MKRALRACHRLYLDPSGIGKPRYRLVYRYAPDEVEVEVVAVEVVEVEAVEAGAVEVEATAAGAVAVGGMASATSMGGTGRGTAGSRSGPSPCSTTQTDTESHSRTSVPDAGCCRTMENSPGQANAPMGGPSGSGFASTTPAWAATSRPTWNGSPTTSGTVTTRRPPPSAMFRG